MFPRLGSKNTLSQEIQNYIEKAIIEKQFTVGSKLPTEKELCEQFEVSRTALREALKMLTAKGLVYIRKGSGAYVKEFNAENVVNTMNLYFGLNYDKNLMIDTIEVLKIIEPKIAEISAEKRTKEELDTIRDSLEIMENCKFSEHNKFCNAEKTFHLTIAHSCNNPVIGIIIKPMIMQMMKMNQIVFSNDTLLNNIISYYRKIYSAISNRDPEKACDEMSSYLEYYLMRFNEN